MAEADLSSIYSCGTQEENAVKIHKDAKKIRLQDSLLSQHLRNRRWVEDRDSEEWVDKILKESAIYEGFDELLWGDFLVCIYKDPATSKLSSLVIDKLGVTHFNPLNISSDSQYYPAIENLDPKDRSSNVRKCIAVSLLEKFAQVTEADLQLLHPQGLKFDYDPTHAGDLASACKLVEFGTPENIGKAIVSLGYLQQRCTHSSLFDVIYEQKSSTTDSNNRIVFNLGEQLEQLFDPLNEYSPEQTEYTYKSPEGDEGSNMDDSETQLILNELFQLQTTFTLNLVEFLQSFLISLRVQVLNNEIDGLSTVKLNRLFPPTIDEVTRINCIFLDSLKSAVPYGSLEVLKACSLTIPYFYKAYTRHEAATKNFNKDVKLFLKRFSEKIPHRDVYTEMKIDTIVKGPQEKLLKIKLIIDRLFKTKQWAPESLAQAKQYYKNVVETIDAFGKLESPMSSYSTRVFTPSGKILTELARGWPVELQYKWLRRRVVGVFDVVEESNQAKRMLLVIFSDYVVFLDINRADIYYKNDGGNKPQIGDILMNSLINEVPLPPKIPKLAVARYCFIDDLFVSSLQNGSLRFDSLREDNAFSVVFKLASKSVSNTTVAELVIKAKILEKETAFHLFRAMNDEISLYLTAHELEAYQTEKIKSKFAIFLNMEPSTELVQKYKLQSAIFLKFTTGTSEEPLQVDIITSDGRSRSKTVLPSEIISQLIQELTTEIPICYSSIHSPILPALLKTNEVLVKRIANYSRQSSHRSENADATEEKGNNAFNPDHEKKKSFGTITTYRSHVSDLKDVAVEGQPPSGREVEQKEHVRTAAQPTKFSTKAAKRSQQSSSPKQQALGHNTSNSNKGRNIVKVILGLFGGKGHSKSQGKSKKDKKAKKITKGPQSRQNLTNSTPAPEITTNNHDKDTTANQRISSVVRKPANPSMKAPTNLNFEQSQTSQNSIEGAYTVKESQQNSGKMVSSPYREVSSSLSSVSAQRVENLIPESTGLGPEEISSADIYKRTDRQSQLFDDDLFGDIVPTPPVVETSNYRDTTEDHGQNSNEKFEPVGSTASEYSTWKLAAPDGSPQKEYPDLAGTISKRNSNLSSGNATNLSMRLTEEDGIPTGAFEDSKDTQIKTEDLLRDELELSPAKEKETPTQPKRLIFPSIPVAMPSKINFERSSSFIELFEGMRLVLDESDAQYNWKCLSNDTPLSHAGHAKDHVPHAFQKIAVATKDGLLNNDEEPPSANKIGRADVVNADSNTDLADSMPAIKSEKEPATLTELPEGDCSLEKSAVNEPNIVKPAPTFKVVKASPTRIVKRVSRQLDSEATDQSLGCNLSLSSNLNQMTDKRWFELKLPSQDDLELDDFYTPVEEPAPKFAEEQQNDSETSSPFESNANANETSEESIPSCRNNQKEKDTALEDFDFSSFHVTFDTVGSKPEGSPCSSSNSGQEFGFSSPGDGHPTISRSKEEPLVYHLPAYPLQDRSRSSASGLSRNLTLSGAHSEDDDPIWVSPSKLEFYDLSKVSEATTRPIKINSAINGTSRGIESLAASKRDLSDRNSLRELSYAYLASYLAPTESQCADDGPERLQFKE